MPEFGHVNLKGTEVIWGLEGESVSGSVFSAEGKVFGEGEGCGADTSADAESDFALG
jgi:hypothetical protein